MQDDLFEQFKKQEEAKLHISQIIKQNTAKTPENFLAKHKIDLSRPIALQQIAFALPTYRVMPNDFARSSLFFVKKKGTPRKTMTREKLFHLSDKVEVRYTGQELRAEDDELVWLSLVHYCYNTPMGEAVDIKVSDLLEDIGWATNGENYEKIRTCISRLKATDIIIKNKTTYGDLEEFKKKREKIASVTRGVSLIGEYAEFDKINGSPTRYLISIDKYLIFFFCGGLFTYLNWKEYKKLTPTGRRLTDYALSHKEPQPLAVKDFLLMCGADTANLEPKRQNQQARRVCDELMKKGVVQSAKVEDGYIVLERLNSQKEPLGLPEN